MSHSKTRIAIRGAYGCGNFGDDALLVAAREMIRRANVPPPLVLPCGDGQYVKRLVPDSTVLPRGNCPDGRVDILIYGGGTQFYSFPLTGRPQSLLLRMFRNMLHPVLLSQKMLRMVVTGKKSPQYVGGHCANVAIGIGLGPFVENCSSIKKRKNLFSRMEYVAVRDTASYDICRAWGVDNVLLRSDLCYLTGVWSPDLANPTPPSSAAVRRIGVIPRDWPHTTEGNAYVESLLDGVAELRQEGRTVDFILFARSADTVWAKRLKAKGEHVRVWDPANENVESFLESLSGYDAFITARYHGAVFASILGKPVICIEIEQKLQLISDLLGQGARLWASPFDRRCLVNHVSDIEENYAAAVRALDRVVKVQAKLADQMAGELKALLCGGGLLPET